MLQKRANKEAAEQQLSHHAQATIWHPLGASGTASFHYSSTSVHFGACQPRRVWSLTTRERAHATTSALTITSSIWVEDQLKQQLRSSPLKNSKGRRIHRDTVPEEPRVPTIVNLFLLFAQWMEFVFNRSILLHDCGKTGDPRKE